MNAGSPQRSAHSPAAALRMFAALVAGSGCAPHHPVNLAPGSFAVEYLGSQIGIGLGCTVLDAPPIGAWTAVVRVSEPRGSGLAVGEQLCAVVHSPTLYVDAGGFGNCSWAPGSDPPLWACGGINPTGLRSFTNDDAAKLDATSRERVDALRARLAALTADTKDCPGLAADVVDRVEGVVVQATLVVDEDDERMFADLEPFIVEARRELEAGRAAAGCPPAAPDTVQRR